jgi:hypothetical protein
MFQRERPLLPRPICFEAVQSKVKENIMNQREIVQALLDSVQRGDFEKAKSFLSNDYQFSGPVPEPINAETWLGIHKNLKKAFPDLDYHFHVDGVEGDVTKISAELKGTHSGLLDLTPVGLGVIPATNKSFATPREHGKVTCKGDKVVSWVVDRIEGGGLMGILAQLGIPVPTM